jgi:type IV pilus assembly protein PilV
MDAKMSNGHAQGFTMIEVLIALVILAIGLLGLAVLQITAMQNSQGGYLRAQASILAYDIVDRMRANITGVNSGTYDLALADAAPASPVCIGAAADCSAADMTQFDLAQWRASLGAYLPGGNGSVATADLGTVTRATVTIEWIDPYSADQGVEQVVLAAELMQ